MLGQGPNNGVQPHAALSDMQLYSYIEFTIKILQGSAMRARVFDTNSSEHVVMNHIRTLATSCYDVPKPIYGEIHIPGGTLATQRGSSGGKSLEIPHSATDSCNLH